MNYKQILFHDLNTIFMDGNIIFNIFSHLLIFIFPCQYLMESFYIFILASDSQSICEAYLYDKEARGMLILLLFTHHIHIASNHPYIQLLHCGHRPI